jgi:DNA-binding transcriptional ArsR family regulator
VLLSSLFVGLAVHDIGLNPDKDGRDWGMLTCDQQVTYCGEVNEVFRALAEPNRRLLLDALRVHDGQTVNELCAVLPDMTRFGVMKHLRVLEDAHLVITERVGRSKHHHLNPVPIREIHDRWIAPYREPFVVGLLALRDRAEGA